MLITVEPCAYIGEREKELGARTKRVVMSFGLERRTDQIGRDDVQMEVSIQKKGINQKAEKKKKGGGGGER